MDRRDHLWRLVGKKIAGEPSKRELEELQRIIQENSELQLFIELAWWIMQSWLQNYTYRINIGWWVFAIAGVMSMGIAVAR